ncbi:NEP1-interacting protein 2 [Hevea brasiliensis]|uniref:NEP1-interacting protein 2 n=1 Tax=Hevea brasiliensis TaxID=3981 RepID=UPI000B772766|nr:NEP1-interacting protein 2 [Hevea brasiliensis]XP_021671951.1 NEP1-interacting protein 2 [Hevea brasiliensis]
MEGFATGFFVRVMKKAVFATFTCILALGGAAVGTVIGAMKGQTTETGFLRGSGIGAVAGAITAVQLLESVADGEPLSKLALFCSLMNGKVFMEWVSPAVLKAYQWQISGLETTYREVSDIYDTSGNRGLSKNCIQKLPQLTFQSTHNFDQIHQFCCSICLQDFNGGDSMRKLPHCGHLFHMDCLDKWLSRNGSCPMCRNYVCDDTHIFQM